MGDLSAANQQIIKVFSKLGSNGPLTSIHRPLPEHAPGEIFYATFSDSPTSKMVTLFY